MVQSGEAAHRVQLHGLVRHQVVVGVVLGDVVPVAVVIALLLLLQVSPLVAHRALLCQLLGVLDGLAEVLVDGHGRIVQLCVWLPLWLPAHLCLQLLDVPVILILADVEMVFLVINVLSQTGITSR